MAFFIKAAQLGDIIGSGQRHSHRKWLYCGLTLQNGDDLHMNEAVKLRC